MGTIHWIKCYVCGGSGWVVEDDRHCKPAILKCRKCDGTGLRETMDDYNDDALLPAKPVPNTSPTGERK